MPSFSSSLKILFALFFSIIYSAAYSQTTLSPGDKLSHSINLDETHSFEISLSSNDFALIEVEQIGIDLKAVIFDAEGKEIDEFDSNNGNNGPEMIWIDPDRMDKYTIEVVPLKEDTLITKGDYSIEVISIQKSVKEQLEKILEVVAEREALPGFAVGIVTKDGVKYQKGYGYADIENKKPYNTETLHNVGSTTKTLIGLSLMKLIEEKKITLNTHINDILPFEVINPHFPDLPITIKHLANHTSTIKETDDYERSYVLMEEAVLDSTVFHRREYADFKVYEQNRMIPMATFLKNIVSKEGEWYDESNFLEEKPGVKYHYSNAAATLAAHIVEIISGMSFDEYVTEHFFKPLGMGSSGFRFDKVDMTRHAAIYGFNKNSLPKYTLITYPDGGMITSISDLNIYLHELIKGYIGKSKLLNQASFKEMMRDHQTEEEKAKYGIFWSLRSNGMMGHNGGDPGIVSNMYFHRDSKIGVTMMTNIIPALADPSASYGDVWSALNRYAKYFE